MAETRRFYPRSGGLKACIPVRLPLGQAGLEMFVETSHVQPVDDGVMHFDGDRHHHALAARHALAEYDAWYRVAQRQRIRERREPEPWQRRVIHDVIVD